MQGCWEGGIEGVAEALACTSPETDAEASCPSPKAKKLRKGGNSGPHGFEPGPLTINSCIRCAKASERLHTLVHSGNYLFFYGFMSSHDYLRH